MEDEELQSLRAKRLAELQGQRNIVSNTFQFLVLLTELLFYLILYLLWRKRLCLWHGASVTTKGLLMIPKLYC